MVNDMRAGAMVTLLAGALVVAPPFALASASRHGPNATRIAAAVRRAERSPNLWATVNICNSSGHRNTIGIRGQMPALGFAATLTMAFQLDYWSSSAARFLPIQSPKARRTKQFGVVVSRLEQAGAQFSFGPHAGRLSGTVTFTWARGGRVIGQTTRATTAGHPSAAYGSPPHYSAAQCTLS